MSTNPALEKQITIDPAYEAVAPDDFAAMIEVDRYAQRSTAFDKIISATHDHFWDPLDPKYIDFAQPFDLEGEMILPEEMILELRLPCTQKLSRAERVRLVSQSARFSLSQILHGEQGALSLSASLCHILKDPGAQEYAANQTREEARHVTAFSRYVQARWGKPLPVGETLGKLLSEIVASPLVYKKLVGMQMLVEGLAMGAFATFYERSRDPLLRKLCQLVMTDEAFHHKFGKIWADRTIPQLSQAQRDAIEDWAAECFQTLLFNLINPEQKKLIYGPLGLDWKQVHAEMREALSDDERRQQMQDDSNIFRVLIKTLLKAGIITERTRPFYASYVNMDALKGEGDRMIGDDIAEDGIQYLKTINFGTNARALQEVSAAE